MAVEESLADRAASLGQPVLRPETTVDPSLHLIAKGRRVRPLYNEGGLQVFLLPRDAANVRLVSRSALPTEVRPWLEDRRRLGVRVKRLVLRGPGNVRDIPLDNPDLSDGWWAVERDGVAMRRWTNGDAFLALPASDDTMMLEVHIGQDMPYLVEDDVTVDRLAKVAA